MVHGLLCGKKVGPDFICALSLGINANNDLFL